MRWSVGLNAPFDTYDLKVAKLDLFAHTFIPPTRIQFAHRFRDIFVMNEDNGVAILSLEDESFKKAVRVGMRKISTYGLRVRSSQHRMI